MKIKKILKALSRVTAKDIIGFLKGAFILFIVIVVAAIFIKIVIKVIGIIK